MRVLVTGAYGLIGGYVVSRLQKDGHEVVGAGRDIVRAQRRMPRVRWIKADLAAMDVAAWGPHLAGVEAVVNCAGALQDSPRDDLKALHVDGVGALARACEAAGLRRFVQISAAGVEGGEGAFSRTKLEADLALSRMDLDWVVLRPALVLAPAAFGGSALLRGLAGFPGFIPALHADAVVQVPSVEDVAEAVTQAIRPGAPARMTCDVAAPEATRLRDVLLALRAWLGFKPAPVLPMPLLVGRLAAWAADGLSTLGWRSPMRTTSVRQLAVGVEARAGGLDRLGIQPRGLAAILDGWPSGVQERWFARLYFAKPLVLATLAVFWCLSGLIALLHQDAAARQLTEAGFDSAAAHAVVLGGAVVDLILGLLVCARRTAPLALIGMVGVTAAYLVGASLWRPDLWGDPLGPLVKTLPAAVLALVGLAIMDER